MALEDELAKSYKPMSEERNAAGRAAKHALPFLRVFQSNHGHQWVPYGAMQAGTQDYEPVEGEFPRCDWLAVYFEGVLITRAGEKFGQWKMTVRGKSLDCLAGHLAGHRMPTINPGTNDRNEVKFSIESIAFEPSRIEGIEG